MRTPLIEALRRPDRYPHRVEHVELVETHISWVLLAGDTVYKLKKPLNLGFLDFSTLEKRRFFCTEEVRLNQRTAPELYLDVIAIRGTPEQPEFGGCGEILDYAVRMRRFDAGAGFDQLLAQGRLEPEHIAKLGRKLAELHRAADTAGPDTDYGTVQSIAGPIRDNFSNLQETLAGEPAAAGLTALQTWTNTELARLTTLINERHRGGFIRECHGDAHLGNVALINGEATLFDCIEFSSELRWIDLMSDVAFAVMDLHCRGKPGFAWRLLDDYLTATGDYRGLRLLPLYLVHRALVRAKVTSLRLADVDADREALLSDVSDYLALAQKTSREQRPAIIITVGLSGSGKSWLAQRLVEHVGLVRIRSDVERKRLYHLRQGDNTGSDLGSGLYASEATARTYHHLAEMVASVIDAGIPCLIDAACLEHWQRSMFRELAAALTVPFGILHCQAEDVELQRRILAREVAAEDPSEAGVDVLRYQQQTMQPLNDQELLLTLGINTTDSHLAHTVEWVRQLTLDGVGHIATT